MILNMTGKGGGGTILVSDTQDAAGGIIRTITAKKVVSLQTKTITPTSSAQTVNPDSGYDGFSQVIVNAGGGGIQIATATATMVQVGEDVAHWDVAYMDNGVLKAGIDIPYDNQYGTNVEVVLVGGSSVSELQADSILDIEGDATYSNGILTITGDCTIVYEGIDDTPILIPKSITSNGTYTAINDDADGYSSVTVNVPTGSTINNQNKTVTPSESQQSITADNGYTGLGTVTVSAISSTYVGTGVARKSSTDLTVSGATVTAPAGYYSAAASKSVSSMTLPTAATSSATSGYTSKATIERSTAAQYINIPPGYNSAGAYYVISAVANGSATAPASISGTAASVSTGTNTITLTKTVSVTPTVSAGYISSGTAGNSSVSLTASVTTKAAATITPTTTNQTIAAGTYLTGTQTIVGDADLVGSNILSTANIFGVQGTVVLQHYYTGSSAPSSSLGSNGDLYLQS